MPPLNNHRPVSVQNMFDGIARRYDLLNRLISLRLDNCWRKRVIRSLLEDGDRLILDLGTGTGDLAFAATSELQGNGRVVGLDFSLEMLRLAENKRTKLRNGRKAIFVLGSALSPPFKEAAFDGVMTAFVLRNIPDLSRFFLHAFRVLKPGGKLVSLDMYPPSKGLFSVFYSFYFYRIVPWIGGVVAHDKNAYQYLADSVRSFDPPEAISSLITQSGFEQVRIQRFLSGAVCLHVGEKPSSADAY